MIEDTIKLLEKLKTVYPQSKMTPESIRNYALELDDIPADLLFAALKRHMDSNPFYPSISEIRTHAREMYEYAAGKTLPRPAEAFDHVYLATKYPARHKIEYPEEKEALRLIGGGGAILSVAEAQFPVLRAQFISAYMGILDKQQKEKLNQAVMEMLPPENWLRRREAQRIAATDEDKELQVSAPRELEKRQLTKLVTAVIREV